MKINIHIQDSISPVEYHKTELSCIFYSKQILRACSRDYSLLYSQTPAVRVPLIVLRALLTALILRTSHCSEDTRHRPLICTGA